MNSRAFTLVELLVATTILVLLVLLLAGAFETIVDTWESGNARVDNFSKARTILGLLNRDAQSAVLRPDIGAFVDQTGANPACAFYTRMEGTNGRRLTLVSYFLTTTLTNSSTIPILERADYSLDYTNTVLTIGTTNSLPDLSKVSAVDVAPGVLLFKIQYINGVGTLQDNFQYDFNNPSSTNNTKAFVASLLVVDNNTVKIAQQTGTLTTLIGKFPTNSTALSANQTFAQNWEGVMNAPTFGQGLPKPLRSGTRAFEGHVTLP